MSARQPHGPPRRTGSTSKMTSARRFHPADPVIQAALDLGESNFAPGLASRRMAIRLSSASDRHRGNVLVLVGRHEQVPS